MIPRRYFYLGALLALSLACAPQTFADAPIVAVEDIKPASEHRRATRLITHFISNYHYKRAALDDELSSDILKNYIESLDPTKSYFTAADIQQFETHRDRIDDYLRSSSLSPVFSIFIRFRQRVQERVEFALTLIDKEWDFSVDESFVFDREDAAWEPDESALDELWRKRIKNDVLSLRLSGKEPADIESTLRKRYTNSFRHTAQLNGEDVFQSFINAYTTSIDPHTTYFSPRTSENFRIRMSLSLEGIGAVLQSENEHTLVREIVPGGPADKSGLLHADDRIVGIGQGRDGELTNVIGWRLDDVVDLIRGPKDSVVQLELLPKDVGLDGATTTIQIVRNKIKLEDKAAQKSVIEFEQTGYQAKVGVIEIPTFYLDFEGRARGEKEYRSTTRDVRRLIGELRQEGIAGLIIDLRSNGGGSLSEATDLTGLFIDQGPVVQVRDSQGRLSLEKDRDRGVAYEGPLVVLVDRNSASASEIFAGAIQDYQRGLVVGEPTFGKGTVQNLVDLNRFDQSMKGKLGQLKATIAQFFRVEGSSTQHRGVLPDITLPTALSIQDHGERAYENALPWASIKPAKFKPAGQGFVGKDKLRVAHEQRILSDPAFQALLAQEKAIIETRRKKEISLVESVRRQEHEKSRFEVRARRNKIRVAHGLEPLPEDDPQGNNSNERSRDDGEDDIDVVLDETGRILWDMIRSDLPAKRLADTVVLTDAQKAADSDAGEIATQ
ncbi:MAG: carboxy terminal-processing peptidase [Pseudomonadota bacterium]